MNKVNAISEQWPALEPAALIPPLSPGAPQPGVPRAARMTLQYRRRSIPTRTMVNTAIKSQMKGPRDGVSFIAIKKYIARHYEPTRLTINSRLRYIKRYILNALESGKLVRTRGTGVCGSFRLPLRSTLRKSMKRPPRKRTSQKKIRAIKRELEKRIRATSPPPGGSGDGSQQLVSKVSKVSLRRSNSHQVYDLTTN